MDFSEKWGTDVDAAVELALQDLKLTIDEVDVTVLEEPSRGFFGIGAKLALVRVEKKKPAKYEKPEATAKVNDGFIKAEKKLDEKKVESVNAEHDKATHHEEAQLKSKTKNTERPARKYDTKLSVAAVPEGLKECTDHPALTFLNEITAEMGLNLEITAKGDDECLYIEMLGKDSGTVIGKRGQTLDAIQYLTSLVVNKGDDKYVRVVVDAENYRAKREKTLIQLANRLADKVYKTNRSVKLEPMNPYERKVIHATLQGNKNVTTRSEGQDPYRRVVIELK